MADTLQQLHAQIVACRACPRLVAWREEVAQVKRRAYRDWDYWGKPVPGWGDPQARLALVGLAPAAHGANRTGRPFTGDGSGGFLFAALHRAGFAAQPTSTQREDGQALTDCFVTSVARCAPPQNRPSAEELGNCRPFLVQELALLPNLQVILCLGQIALEGVIRTLQASGTTMALGRGRPKFAHGAHYDLGAGLPHVMAVYHPSRQNTNTGRLTAAMFDEVLFQAKARLRSIA